MTSKRTAAGLPSIYRVALYRANGRYVRSWPAASRYAAKRLRQRLEQRYDETYYLKVEPKGESNGNDA